MVNFLRDDHSISTKSLVHSSHLLLKGNQRKIFKMYEYETLSQVIYLLQVKMNCHYTIIKIIYSKEIVFFKRLVRLSPNTKGEVTIEAEGQ